MKRNILYLILSVVLSCGAAYLISEKIVDKRMSDADFYKTTEVNHDKVERRRDVPKNLSTDGLVNFSDAAEMAVQTVVYVNVNKNWKYS